MPQVVLDNEPCGGELGRDGWRMVRVTLSWPERAPCEPDVCDESCVLEYSSETNPNVIGGAVKERFDTYADALQQADRLFGRPTRNKLRDRLRKELQP